MNTGAAEFAHTMTNLLSTSIKSTADGRLLGMAGLTPVSGLSSAVNIAGMYDISRLMVSIFDDLIEFLRS